MATKTTKKVTSALLTNDGAKTPIAKAKQRTTKSSTCLRPLTTPLAGRALTEGLALPELPQPIRGDKINLGIVAGSDSPIEPGTQPTAGLRAGATDLCEIAPSGQVALAGDTFTGNACLQGDWSPSLGLRVRTGSLGGKVAFDSSFGWQSLYAEGWIPGGSQLPAGTVQVFGHDYALITRTKDPQLTPNDSRLVRINPTNGGWPTVPGSQRPADWQWGNQTQISGCQAPDGMVYIVADGFNRDHPVVLYHCPAANFENRDRWWAWARVGDGPEWAWDQPDVPPTPLSTDNWGELSLRMIEGMFVLSGFNQSTLRVEVRVTDDVTQVLSDQTPMTIVADPDSVPNNYGGYIVPGSTLDQALILVSQWVPGGYPYNVQEFVVNLNR